MSLEKSGFGPGSPLYAGPRPILGIVTFALLACGDGESPTSFQEATDPQPCLFADERCWERVPLGGGLYLPIYRSFPFLEGNPQVDRAIIVVHGTLRNAGTYFETMIWVTQREGVLPTTLVIAPHFQTAADGAGADEPIWTSNGWKRGDQSNGTSADPDGISSYEAVDRLLAYLGFPSRFPSLEKVVVTGHSAGGQYTHRFAAGSQMEDSLTHLHFRYVVANPSTYLYLGPERAGEQGGWQLPDRTRCPDYNQWHLGLEEVNPYIAAQELDETQSQLIRRNVLYLVGEKDVGTDMLDMSCGAMLQGRNRFLRGLTLFDFMEYFYPQHQGRIVVVPGVAHSSSGIYLSNEGTDALFAW